MVYNAMKMFMDMDPQLFDECTSAYNRSRAEEPEQQALLDARWKELEMKAQQRQRESSPKTKQLASLQVNGHAVDGAKAEFSPPEFLGGAQEDDFQSASSDIGNFDQLAISEESSNEDLQAAGQVTL